VPSPSRLLSFSRQSGSAPASRIAGLAALYLTIVCAIGMLHPIRNALALGGLGARGFYKVYLASAGVALFLVPYNRLAARVPQRWLTPGVALFFALDLLLFRALFPGGRAYGFVFYAWHDLFASVLVSQFFLATQELLDVRTAKAAYPAIVAGGAVGATLGGVITGFLTSAIGLGNILLVAAALTAIFAVALPFLTSFGSAQRREPAGVRRRGAEAVTTLREVAADRLVRLIAASVLVTTLVAQLVDYQFNAYSAAAFERREAISEFQGKFNALTQWISIAAAAALQPLLARWGVGAALSMLPGAMLLANVAAGLWTGLAAAAVAKATDKTLRVSSDRTGREILFIAVPDRIKVRAKPIIDVALDSGGGKAMAAGLIFLLMRVIPLGALAWVAAALALTSLLLSRALRREYVRALARSVRTHETSLQGLAASLGDADTLAEVRRVLGGPDAREAEFALDLLAQASVDDVHALAPDLRALSASPSARVRAGALGALARSPADIDVAAVRSALGDPDVAVRAAAANALRIAAPDDPAAAAARRNGGALGAPFDPSAAIAALASRRTREAASAALVAQGAGVIPTLDAALRAEGTDWRSRLTIPDVLAQFPHAESAGALLRASAASDVANPLGRRALAALHRLHRRAPDVPVDAAMVDSLLGRALGAAARYRAARVALAAFPDGAPTQALLRRAVAEAWEARREDAFRCLALVHPPRVVDGCYRALVSGTSRRANEALELLKEGTGTAQFARLAPVIDDGTGSASGLPPSSSADLIAALAEDDDPWVACCAAAAQHATSSATEATMDLFWKVFLLQKVDVFRGVRSEHLAVLAGVAEEIDADPGALLLRTDEAADAMYVVVSGEVTLRGPDGKLRPVTDGDGFGALALLAEEPGLLEARAARPTRLLRITRNDLFDMLADSPEFAEALLRGMASRLDALLEGVRPPATDAREAVRR
jgi:Cyclic nucleotide-binding domain